MRKQPTQARARRRVEALIDATAAEIAERGLAETTTNHIAARAGVSIGSLYQYFDGKNDLVGALLRRLSDEIAEVVDATLADAMDADVRGVVRRLLETTLAAVDRQPALYLELTRNWRMTGAMTVIEALEAHMIEACRRYVLHHHDRLNVADLHAVLFVVINGTLFPVMRYLSLREPGFDREQLVAAVSDMIAGYAETALAR